MVHDGVIVLMYITPAYALCECSIGPEPELAWACVVSCDANMLVVELLCCV